MKPVGLFLFCLCYSSFLCVCEEQKNPNNQEEGVLLCVGAGVGWDLGPGDGQGGEHGVKLLLLAGELCNVVKITQTTVV